MRARSQLISAAICLFTAGQGLAADLEGCVRLAVANSKAVKAYEEKLSSALAANKRDRSSRLPQLSASGEDGYSTYGADSGLKDGLTGKVGLQLNWDLPKVLAGYPRLSRLEADKAAVQLALAKKELTLDVAKDYYQLHILGRKKADYAAAREYFVSHIKDIERLRDQGLDVKLDLLRAGIQLKSLGATAADLDTQLAGALLSLNSSTGADFNPADFKFEDIPLPGVTGIPADIVPADGLQLRLNELEFATAAENYRQSAYAYAPYVALGLDKSVTPIDPAAELYRTFLTLNVGIFDFGQRAADRKSLLADREYQRNLSLDNRKKLTLAAARLRGEIGAAAFACAAAAANLADADRSLETAREYYRQGKIKETDLLSVFSEYLGVKEQERDALGLFLDKKAELDYLQAGGL